MKKDVYNQYCQDCNNTGFVIKRKCMFCQKTFQRGKICTACCGDINCKGINYHYEKRTFLCVPIKKVHSVLCTCIFCDRCFGTKRVDDQECACAEFRELREIKVLCERCPSRKLTYI